MIYYEAIPHKGSVNRIRTMHGTQICATWNDEGEVQIFDLEQALQRVQMKTEKGTQVMTQKKYNSLLKRFKHGAEGYGLDWSPLAKGVLASGGCDRNLCIYRHNGGEFEMEKPLKGHTDSVEDVQFSPKQQELVATCSVDRTIKLWDLREDKRRAVMSWEAHSTDVNVISWNDKRQFLLASGADDGEFRVWDLRQVKKNPDAPRPITDIKWHNDQITTLQFQPREECVLAVASADNRMTLWDFSVEPDSSEPVNEDIPPQLLFLHQGQKNIKELRFHPLFDTVLGTTAEDSFNVFRPNLDPEQQPDDEDQERAQVDRETARLTSELAGIEEEAAMED